MTNRWRRIGWQQMQLIVPADWYLSKIGTDRSSGDLWLADDTMPRLQIKWMDASREKSVDPTQTLQRYLQQIERRAAKQRQPFELQRDISLVSRAGRDISSIESYHWQSDTQAYGVIWYSREAQRVTLAQVNGALDEKDLKATARQVLNSLRDITDAEEDLWTAYDLECRLPRDMQLLGQQIETGHTELKFGRQKDVVTIARFGLAAIALSRAGNLGDWAFTQRYRDWSSFALDRLEGEQAGQPAFTFRGRKKSWAERLRQRSYNFLSVPYPIELSARAWHCAEANCLYLVEHFRDARSEDLLDWLCERIPCTPTILTDPKA